MILVFTAFIIKHFIADFPLQPPYQWMNKGKYGHPGGLLHTGIHGVFTLIILWWFNLPLWLTAIDIVVHYHVDWAKMQFKYTPDNKYFWWLLGVDQMLHYLTYVFIIWMAV